MRKNKKILILIVILVIALGTGSYHFYNVKRIQKIKGDLALDYLGMHLGMSRFWKEPKKLEGDDAKGQVLYLAKAATKHNERFQKKYLKYKNIKISDEKTIDNVLVAVQDVTFLYSKVLNLIGKGKQAEVDATIKLMGDAFLHTAMVIWDLLVISRDDENIKLAVSDKQKSQLLDYINEFFGADIQEIEENQKGSNPIWSVYIIKEVLEGRTLK